MDVEEISDSVTGASTKRRWQIRFCFLVSIELSYIPAVAPSQLSIPPPIL